MKVFIINAVPYGSTGRIMFDLADHLKNNGHDVLCTSGFTWRSSDREDFFITSNIVEKQVHTIFAKTTGRIGGFSHIATLKLIKKLKEFEPDVIHLHNLHGWFVNLKILFDFIKKRNIPVVWTLHDCWAFTGHCPHYAMIECEKWKDGCYDCPQYKSYPRTYFDFSKKMYREKKKIFTEVENLTVVTPSKWMASQVEQSFLKDYDVKVINNGIDIEKFSIGETTIKNQLGIDGKFMVLGVAYDWNDKKGLDVFISLAKTLGEEFKVVLVGTNEKTDMLLPDNIISIHRTQDQQQLVEIYRAADVMINPTREDTFPTVNIEALACGTPVITFDTGGSPEIIDETSGSTIYGQDTDSMRMEIIKVCKENVFSREDCRKRGESFSNEKFLSEYLKLYERKCNE